MNKESETLYSTGDRVMRKYIGIYLELARKSKGFTDLRREHLPGFEQKIMVLGGIGSPLDPADVDSDRVVGEWQRMRAVTFDVEKSITKGVYIELRARVRNLIGELKTSTSNFLSFDSDYISEHPYFLPVLQRLADISSKAELKRRIGNASDNAISTAAAERLAEILNQREPGRGMTHDRLIQSIEPTLEGIVRDLVGKVLLEGIVANALEDAGIPYKRESEYSTLKGVVYSFQADFVIPDEHNPMAFVEVRKSSSRHASLYAKDKMFSAINWKGENQDLLAVLVIDGPWTHQTLSVMAKVFDYIVPISLVSDVAEVISAYIQGDRSKLRWLVDFAIHPANQ
jgi:hypothetical protein